MMTVTNFQRRAFNHKHYAKGYNTPKIQARNIVQAIESNAAYGITRTIDDYPHTPEVKRLVLAQLAKQ